MMKYIFFAFFPLVLWAYFDIYYAYAKQIVAPNEMPSHQEVIPTKNPIAPQKDMTLPEKIEDKWPEESMRDKNPTRRNYKTKLKEIQPSLQN